MSSNAFVSIQSVKGTVMARKRVDGKILLVKPPYFTPWTPPLGIAILKSFLEQHQFSGRCYDFNTDPELWGMHHKYFAALQRLEGVSINDGYSKLWWILDAHMLAYANGADPSACARVLEGVVPLYGMDCDRATINVLLPLVERFFKRLEVLTEQIDLSEFAVVGTSTYTTSLAASLFILKIVKQKHPHLKTVMGGGVFADDLALGSDNLSTLVEEYPYIDHVILGEGELLLLKLLEGEFAHKRIISIADLKGQTLEMKDVPAPDFSDLNRESYYHLTIEGARSCPFQCSFCSETIQWGDYRKKPAELMVDQVMELAGRYDNNAFFMGDSLMNPYLNSFAGKLLDKGASIIYDGYLRADKPVTNRKFVKMWAESGLYRVRLGIESASARVLDSMDKMTSPSVISDVLKTLAWMGIRTTTYWIVGFPGETEQDFQETCDFIRRHHRYIYELEAHPYYYYPYGQIGSRLYQCHSLYPDEVTNIIKFKVWDIDSISPNREVRYDRLRRISKLAASLGLPNIYTMSDRYQAENRWHGLHPLALAVHDKKTFGGGRARASNISLPGPAAGRKRFEREKVFDASAVYCYRATATKRLDEGVLAAALERLVACNEMLQLSLQDDGYVADAGDVHLRGESMLFVFDEDDGGGARCSEQEIVERPASGMRPACGDSVRVALVRRSDNTSELFLLAHRSIADSRSVALLFEDLFRLYEQLTHKREVSLCPVKKSFGEFISEQLAQKGKDTAVTPWVLSGDELPGGVEPDAASGQAQLSRPKEGREVLRFDEGFTTRLLDGKLKEAGESPHDLIVLSLLKALTQEFGSEELSLDVLGDYRALDAELSHTVGPLTRINVMPPEALREAGLLPFGKSLRAISEEHSADAESRGSFQSPGSGAAAERVLLSREYLVAEPWLGGDEWLPKGFVLSESGPRAGYMLEILPVLSGEKFEVHFRFRAEARALKAVVGLLASVPAAMESGLQSCEDYIEARRFWFAEFVRCVPALNLDIDGQAQALSGTEFASQPCRLTSGLIERVRAQSGGAESVVLLSAFAALLSRLSGQQEVLIAAYMADGRGRVEVPLRLAPSWELSFGDFIRQVDQKITSASLHSSEAFELLNDKELLARESITRPVFNLGYIYQPAAQTSALMSPEKLRAFGEPMKLVLAAEHSGEEACLRLFYDTRSFSRDTAETISSYMNAVLVEAGRSPSIKLGELSLAGEQKRRIAAKTLATAAFDFD
jgi:radical SAM superfamily enzyme YgiQ (UPF0313 family)